ncbi:hypothetical protein [Autumnicola musiva]|uniref:Uncharacterized protein n=1 Tax=Autumnicola musiva TaxID=3075589 RepID=A0ABU3D4S7_9FLAO|nr:hypothetical protein [Zunongwangia sp. F117]MDT0676531.1 hypothetical protein [Zunongwangia sp. F117]
MAIRIDNPLASSRWYPGGGIYRNFWLVKKAPVHVGQWDTFETRENITKDSANVNLNISINNTLNDAIEVSVENSIYDLNDDGKKEVLQLLRLTGLI